MSDGQSVTWAGPPASPPTEGVARELAIPAIGQAPWGTHFCQFYATKQDLLDTLVPYFRAGLEGNELCLWTTCDPLGVDDAVEALSRQVKDIERRIALGQITIRPAPTDCPPTRDTGPGLWNPRIKRALTQGFAGLRATGGVSESSALRWEALMTYESFLASHFPGRHVIALCTYPLGVCDSLKLIDVLMRHRFALIKHEDWTLIEPSEQKRATAAVERMNQALTERTAQLQAAVAELRGFGRWATDDLRAPLRSITRFGTWLAESCEDKLDDEERQLLDRIRINADRMSVLIADIQRYTAAQQNGLHVRSLDLEALTRNVWAGLAGTIGGRRVELKILPLPPAYGDRALLTRVLANLLDNAVKFTVDTPDARIEVGAATAPGECVYYVRDNGIGFDPTYAERIFEPFERLHGKGAFAGSGLGLATVKAIITRLGGQVWADGVPGGGATFFFTLPEPGQSTLPGA